MNRNSNYNKLTKMKKNQKFYFKINNKMKLKIKSNFLKK